MHTRRAVKTKQYRTNRKITSLILLPHQILPQTTSGIYLASNKKCANTASCSIWASSQSEHVRGEDTEQSEPVYLSGTVVPEFSTGALAKREQSTRTRGGGTERDRPETAAQMPLKSRSVTFLQHRNYNMFTKFTSVHVELFSCPISTCSLFVLQYTLK